MDFSNYLSPFSWRYASQEMRSIWSEENKRLMWRRLWVALATVQAEYGLVSPSQLDDLKKSVNHVKVLRALEIEAEIQHDLMAELKTFAEQSPHGGSILHLGATSMDIEDNAQVLLIRQALDLVLEGLKALLLVLTRKMEAYADLPVMAFTHLQPAEPSTLGHRLGLYSQDLYLDYQALSSVRSSLRGKGFRGAVGTGAAFSDLIGEENLERFQARLSYELKLDFFPLVSQVYPRKQDYQVVSALASLGGSLYKFAFDLRFLQTPGVGEMSEPFGKKQVGSSAMPFKRNPIQAEKIDSLARYLAEMPRIAWDNAAHSLLERTLDDSANRRSLIPEAFLVCDEILRVSRRIFTNLEVHTRAIEQNLLVYGPFAAIERILMASVKAGADRQVMHERLRQHALSAWSAVQSGGENPLLSLLKQDSEIGIYLSVKQIETLMDASRHIGDAPQRVNALAQEIRQALAECNE